MMLERWRPRRRELASERPLRELDQALEEMERHFEDIFGLPFFPVTWRRTPTRRAWSPPMEVFEKENEYVIKAELPGMKKDEISVSAAEDTLTVKGERKGEQDVKEENYHLCERCYGRFERSVSLPTDVDTTKVKAKYENGVLEVRVPKLPEAKPKEVDISVE